MDVRLDGKVALVTGAAGGFGRAYSGGLARAGAAVAVADVNGPAAEAVASAIRAEGGQARAFAVDVAVAAEVRGLVEAVVATFGGLDILLNIAGINPKHDLMDIPEEEWDRVLDINLKGMYLCCRAAIPHLIARGGGRIINMASSRGLYGQVHGAHYAASKGGVIALTKSLAQELAADRITVNAMAPGATDTPMWEQGMRELGRTTQELDAIRRSGAIGRPEDLVPVAVLLASELGYQLTGHVVVRDIYMPR